MAGLEDLYREIILDHYRNPRNRGELPTPPAVRAEGYVPGCGDEITVYVEVVDGVVANVTTTGQGCSISQSSASLMSAAVKGRPVGEVRDLIRTFKSMMSIHEARLDTPADGSEPTLGSPTWGSPTWGSPAPGSFAPDEMDTALGELGALQGVVKFPVRIKCATISWNALAQGLEEAAPA